MNDYVFIVIMFLSIVAALIFAACLIAKCLFDYRYKVVFKPTDFMLQIQGGEWKEFDGLRGYMIPSTGPEGTEDNVIIYNYGCGVNLTFYKDYANILSSYGNVFLYDYSGYGNSKGKVGHDELLNSGVKAYDYVKTLGYKNIYVYGFSLGGCVATYIASKRECSGVIIESSFYRLSDTVPIIGRIIIGDHFRTYLYAKKVNAPVVILHSETDGVISIGSAKALMESFMGPKLFLYINGGHNQHDISRDTYNSTFRFLTKRN